MFPEVYRRLYQALLLFNYGAQAITHTEQSPQPSLADTSLSRRSLSNIIAGCVSVTLFVTWASVHPNARPIATPRTARLLGNYTGNLNIFFKTLSIGFFVFFMTVIAPELVIAWSLQQWFAAREITKQYTDDNSRCPPCSCI